MTPKQKKQLLGILRHALTLPATFIINKWFWDLNYFQFGQISSFWRIFLLTFVSFCVAGIIEWIQGAFYGANSTPMEKKDMYNDIIISTVAGFIGALLSNWYFNLFLL